MEVQYDLQIYLHLNMVLKHNNMYFFTINSLSIKIYNKTNSTLLFTKET